MQKTRVDQDWKQILRKNFTNKEKLADFLLLNEHQKMQIIDKPGFILNLPLRLAQKIEKGTLEDPILKQFLPTLAEQEYTEGFVLDPVGDLACRRSSKLLHKYDGRVLIVTTSACAMHCRYCFRKNFDYDVEDNTFVEELQCIENDSSITEVILSGGDPLSLSDSLLESLLLRISSISHVKRIRFHSRFPIGIPERINERFLSIIEKLPQQIWFVIHVNHPKELDDDIFYKLDLLKRLGVIVLNQAVLLKNINDEVEVLHELCETLVNRGILPYYLHQLDRVQGAAHFEVSKEKGLQLVEALTKSLPGYAVPKYVQEIEGEQSKTSIGIIKRF